VEPLEAPFDVCVQARAVFVARDDRHLRHVAHLDDAQPGRHEEVEAWLPRRGDFRSSSRSSRRALAASSFWNASCATLLR
jgi:hypothetical protein